MSETKPVYQARMLFENMFCECDQEQFLKIKELNNCETRILYPAAALEALQAENAAQAKRIEELEAQMPKYDIEAITTRLHEIKSHKELPPDFVT